MKRANALIGCGACRRVLPLVLSALLLIAGVCRPALAEAQGEVFTAREQAYIESSGTIVVGLNASRAPFSEYDPATGVFTGICVDILDMIAQSSGLKFQYAAQTPSMGTIDLLASGAYNIICGTERDNFIDSESVVSTDSFMESAIVPVARAGQAFNLNDALTAAVPASFQALQKQLKLNYPSIQLITCPTNRDCLNKVVSGEADIFIQNTHILSQLLQEPQYENLDIMPVQIMTEHTAMALPRNADPSLLSVLNKAIAGLESAAVSASLIAHTFASPYQLSVGDVIYKFRYHFAIIGALMLVCFILLLAVIVVRRRNEMKLSRKNAQLTEAVAQADRASTAKSQFLSRMSHEIRTPMNAIVGLTAIAKQHEEDPARIDNYLSKIETSSKVLLSIINDVLDMSAIESNKLKIAHEEFDIKHVLTGISTIYYPQCEAKGVAFHMVADLENEILVGDSLRLNQILMNMVSNAYKFTQAGGKIDVFARETARRDKMAFLRFIVSDTGVGMTEDMKKRLFRPFEQESADTAQSHGGSGLGLSITKNLVGMMHGAISVESEKNKGTTFTVDLPFEYTDKMSAMSSEALKHVRVLAADDDASAREYTAIVLGRIGVAFDIASSGKETLEMAGRAEGEGRPYDVCLVDWKMPDMDGVEVTKILRKTESGHMLIIIISAFDLNEEAEEAREAGADQFISKPLFQSTIFNALMVLTGGELKKETALPEAYDFTGRRVLLAEDNDMNAEIAAELLNLVHLTSDRAADGQTAVTMFAESAPGAYDAILMDVQMPLLDGYGAARAIRAMERPDAKTIPILAMTANAFTEDVSAALSAGMNGHIAKPIDTATLYGTLAKVIMGR